MGTSESVDAFFADTREELARAQARWSAFTSGHEGYAVIEEEFDELWDHVRLSQSKRDPAAMRRECVQIAAMAARFAVELCDTGKVNER